MIIKKQTGVHVLICKSRINMQTNLLFDNLKIVYGFISKLINTEGKVTCIEQSCGPRPHRQGNNNHCIHWVFIVKVFIDELHKKLLRSRTIFYAIKKISPQNWWAIYNIAISFCHCTGTPGLSQNATPHKFIHDSHQLQRKFVIRCGILRGQWTT